MPQHCLLHSQLSCFSSRTFRAAQQPPTKRLPARWRLHACQHSSVHCAHARKKERSSNKCCAWRNRKQGQPPPQAPQSDSTTTPPEGPTDATAGSSQQNNGVTSGGKPSDSAKQKSAQHSPWEDWEDWDSDWEAKLDDDGPRDQFRKNNPRRGMGSKTPRDEYLRPMIDTLGIQYRLGFKQFEAEERVQTEFETNQWESREAVKFGVTLLVAPLITGWILSSIIANPIFTAITRWNPRAFEISERQKVEGAKEVHKAEMRMRMDAAIGRAPPLSYNELQAQLRHEALELVEEFQEQNKHNVLNVISDSITATTGFIILVKDKEGRGILFRTFGRVFGGLSDTAKAFMIIASTDILLGYHSEEGWTAAIRLITAHYGSEVEEGPIYTFVAIVPVTLDACFKYWIFKGLNRKNPAAAVTLKSMDRH